MPLHRHRPPPLFTRASGLGSVREYEGKAWGVDVVFGEQRQEDTAGFRTFVKRRFAGFFLVVAALTLILFGRLLELQVVRGATLRTAAEENRLRRTPIKASRGIIFDRNGEPLVKNVPDLALQVIPADLPEGNALQREAEKLAAVLQEAPVSIFDELSRRQSHSYVPEPLREHLFYDTALRVRLIESELPGVHVNVTARRQYLGGPAFSHVLGYTGKITQEVLNAAGGDYNVTDIIGKEGVERSYEQQLRGKDGQEQVEVNSLGKEQQVVASAPPHPGMNLTLTIDAQLQRRGQEALDAMVEKTHGTGGALVAMDPRDGAIRALVSSPAYDNNLFAEGIATDQYAQLLAGERRPLFHRAIAGQYPPGSTLKPFIAAGALQERIITAATKVLSTGGIRVGLWFFPDWKVGGHGVTDVRKAIAESVNSFFYTIGGGTQAFSGMGVQRITAYLAKFGLGAATGIDLIGEAEGFLPSPDWKQRVKRERWYIGDTYHLSIGQGDVLVTPLQMAVATSAIANNGTLYRPRLVQAMGLPGAKQEPQAPQVLGASVVDAQYLATVREGMRQAVVSGSARGAQALPVAVAGKTGTAQFGPSQRTNAWFTAFAPYEQPELAVTVIVEAGGEGHAAALPVAVEVLRAYFPEMPVEKPS